MGIGGISVGSLLVILGIVAVLFGTKRLRGIGGDLGGALAGFRSAMRNDRETAQELPLGWDSQPSVTIERPVAEQER